jgi:hypothetical protein
MRIVYWNGMNLFVGGPESDVVENVSAPAHTYDHYFLFLTNFEKPLKK